MYMEMQRCILYVLCGGFCSLSLFFLEGGILESERVRLYFKDYDICSAQNGVRKRTVFSFGNSLFIMCILVSFSACSTSL